MAYITIAELRARVPSTTIIADATLEALISAAGNLVDGTFDKPSGYYTDSPEPVVKEAAMYAVNYLLGQLEAGGNSDTRVGQRYSKIESPELMERRLRILLTCLHPWVRDPDQGGQA